MASLMAASAVSVVGVSRVAVSAACHSVGSSPGRISLFCSSFKGLSLRSWKAQQNGRLLSTFSTSSSRSPRGFPVAKLKTHKAAAKRFKVTGSGKIVRRRAGRAHLLQKKNTKRKNRLSGKVQVNRSDYDNVIGALPYLKVNRSV